MSKIQNKERALEALLTAPTLSAAAEQAGLDRKTLYNYLRNDSDFAFSYKKQREIIEIQAAEQAAAERDAALAVFRNVMNDSEQPAAIRLKAAAALLDIAQAGIDRQRQIAGNLWDIHVGFPEI